jgi:hypothetical protein
MKKIYLLFFAALLGGSQTEAQTYCTPSYTSSSYPTGGCSYARITNFVVSGASGTMLVDSLGCTGSGWEDNHALSWMTCTMNIGGTYSATTSYGTPAPKEMQVWVDFNNDGTFDTTESVGGGVSSSGYTLSYSIVIPSGVSAGNYRMRWVSEYAPSGVHYPYFNPCLGAPHMYCDVRDYTVTISSASSSGCTGTPTGGTASSAITGYCAYNYVNLATTGATSGSGISYLWQESTDGGTTWSNIATATSTTTAVMEPTVNTLYRCMVSCSGSSSSAYSSVTAVNIDKIHGHISYSAAAPDTTDLKVWLIYHNTSAGTLTAIDSVITCNDSLAPYYEFNHMGAGSYLVKAMSLDRTSSVPGASGFAPTYGASSATWSAATTINHTSPVDVQNINMIWGTVPSGPGFIGGLISSGAGKGTTGDVPAVNMEVLLRNVSSGVITHKFTDALGAYAFSGLATGTYVVYPEKLGDSTVSFTVTLTSSVVSATGINFKEYTTSKIIKPITAGIAAQQTAVTFGVYPNPTNGNITIRWNQMETGNAAITITDVTGREVYNSNFSMNSASGNTAINLAGLNNGMYFIRINTAGINYSEKLMIQH